MAEDKLNQDQDQDQAEQTPGEMTENDLTQVSGGMQSGLANNHGEKYIGNLVNGDGIKKNQVGDIPFSKTVKL
jgi:hypothetical protein